MKNLTVDMGNDGYKVDCELTIDGSEFCVKPIGLCFSASPCGFGTTVREAVTNLKSELRNKPPVRESKQCKQ